MLHSLGESEREGPREILIQRVECVLVRELRSGASVHVLVKEEGEFSYDGTH